MKMKQRGFQFNYFFQFAIFTARERECPYMDRYKLNVPNWFSYCQLPFLANNCVLLALVPVFVHASDSVSQVLLLAHIDPLSKQ